MTSRLQSSAVVLALALLALGGLSCEQYEYNSPLPGVVEFRLAVKNNRTELLNWVTSDTSGGSIASFFPLTLRTLEIFRNDGARQPIYANLYAVRRNDVGDPYNSLDTLARDSAFVLGVGYLPPGTYTRVEVTIQPSPTLLRSFGFYFTQVEVRDLPPFQALQRLPDSTSTLTIPVEEGKTTRVVVTFDMDRSLIQRDEWFDHIPHYFVSSVRVF